MKDDYGQEIFVSAAEIPAFFSGEFWEAYEFYAATEMLAELGAQPFSGGWTDWPEVSLKTLLVFKTESSRCDAEDARAKAPT